MGSHAQAVRVMLRDRFELFVPGRAVPQGSKTAFVSKSTGRAIVVDKDMRLPRWRMKITAAAIEQQAEYRHTRPALTFPIEGAVGIKVAFTMERPKNHYGTGRNASAVKPSAPRYPAAMPDIDKLLRAVFDALTDARVWKDDGQAVWVQTTKTYGDEPGVHITLGAMT
jgi:Holliday junction resolvase RusA-like endonuclease